jgi:hypothetical protein
MINTRSTLKYRVVNGYNPRTRETLKRPQITERETLYLDQVVKFALDNGFVRGQFHDVRGTVNGFIEAIQYLGLNGKAVSLNDWLRVHAELTGTVGENYQLSSSNELRVCIQALKELKTSVDNFNWTNVSDMGAVPRIDSLMQVGGTANWKITRNKEIILTGKNLAYDATLGDTAIITWQDGSETKSAAITPVESDYSHQKFEWPTDLNDVPAGTEISFAITLHGGAEGGAAHMATKSVTLVD